MFTGEFASFPWRSKRTHISARATRCFPLLLFLQYLFSVTLNYCAALGLMEVGALPKPEMWVHHRMKHPAKADSNPDAVKDAVMGEDGKTFDLSKMDSDDED